MKKNSENIRKITTLGVMAALAVLAAGLLQFSIIPAYPFLKYDPADIILLLGGLTFGPWWGLALVFVTAVLQELIFGGIGGWIGIVMHFLASGALVVVASLIYKAVPKRSGLIVGLASGALAMITLMIPLNLVFTPIYTGWPRSAVAEIILPGILPFNAIKAGVNSLIAFFLLGRLRFAFSFIGAAKSAAPLRPAGEKRT